MAGRIVPLTQSTQSQLGWDCLSQDFFHQFRSVPYEQGWYVCMTGVAELESRAVPERSIGQQRKQERQGRRPLPDL